MIVARFTLFLAFVAAAACPAASGDEPTDAAKLVEEIRQLREEVRALSKSVDELKSSATLADAKQLAELLDQNDPEIGLRMWGASVAEEWRENSTSYRAVVYRGADPGLRYLARLPDLQVLDLSYSQVTDDGLRWIAGIKDLRELNLVGTPIGDEGLKHLAGLTSLQRLEFNSRKVTGAGLRSLAKLENLEQLRIADAAIDDASLENLAGLSKLTYLALLHLNDTLRYPDKGRDTFRGDGLKHLTKLKQLKEVDLMHTRIRDEALEHLANMPSLTSLQLGVQYFGPAGVEHLKRMTKLEYLEGGVDSEQQREVQEALPKLFIYNP